MGVESIDIHTALAAFASHAWLGIFIDSLSSILAIRHHNINPCARSSLRYHHHMLLLESITDILETKRLADFHTALHKIRANTNIRGKNLNDAAAKLVVMSFDTHPLSQTMRVNIGELAFRPVHRVMYTANPPAPDSTLSTGTDRATLRRPWWSIPEADRLQMHVFIRPSPRLRLKVRDAPLRRLYHTSLYRRIIIADKEKKARLISVG
jgi:hypothetical protein